MGSAAVAPEVIQTADQLIQVHTQNGCFSSIS